MVVEQLWKAKQKRQIIFASHNARRCRDQLRGTIAGEGAIDVPNPLRLLVAKESDSWEKEIQDAPHTSGEASAGEGTGQPLSRDRNILGDAVEIAEGNGRARQRECSRGQALGGYLAFLGRIAPEKRPDRAIEIAVRTGIPLKIATKFDRADQA